MKIKGEVIYSNLQWFITYITGGCAILLVAKEHFIALFIVVMLGCFGFSYFEYKRDKIIKGEKYESK